MESLLRTTVAVTLATIVSAFLAPHIASADPVAGSFADCIVVNAGDRPYLQCGDEAIDIRNNFDAALARIKEREADAITTSGIYERYLRMLDQTDQVRVENLAELASLLALSYTALYNAFVDDVSATLSRLRNQVSTQSEALVSAYRRFDPAIGITTDAPQYTDPFDEYLRDHLAEIVVSSDPPEITALDVDPPPISSIPFVYGSIRADGLTGDTGDIVTADTRFTIGASNYCIDADYCPNPSGWDYVPYQLTVVWKSLTLSQQEVEDIVSGNGFEINLSVNGARLNLGPPDTSGSPGKDWFAVAMQPTSQTGLYDAPYCPNGYRCIATTIYARKAIADKSLPWRIGFEINKLVEMDPPIVIIDPNSGESVGYATGREPYSDVNYTISANSTNGLSFFVEAISPTFKSDRCMDCHGLNTVELLAEHHDLYYNNADDFIKYLDVQLEPSAYVAGAHVITCTNCHYLTVTDNNGHEFEETVWKAPYVDLNIDWRLKTPSQICQRVLQNLPTHELRHTHFAEDARLYWAIEEPYVGGTLLQPKAYPFDHDEFLFRTFLWSYYIASCP